MFKVFFPSESCLNHAACALVGLAFVALFGLVVWMIVDVEMPFMTAGWHR